MRWTPPSPAAALEALDATWSALERVALGPWVLRRGGGGGRRASSTQPRGAAPDDLDAALAAVVAQNAAWGQPALFQLGPQDGALDAALAARGWAVCERNRIYAAPSAALAGAVAEPLMAVRVDAPLAALDALWDEGGVGPPRRAVMAAVARPKARMMIRAGDRPAAACFVAADGDIAVLSALWVAPPHRRRGAAHAAVAAAADWAAQQGAPTLALAVSAGNGAAISLYESLGFRAVCGYVYRVAP